MPRESKHVTSMREIRNGYSIFGNPEGKEYLGVDGRVILK
jgi:hypothetical protein